MSGVTWQIRSERGEDDAQVEALVMLSFGAGRFAKTAYRLREGAKPDARLSFVAEENKQLLGSVRFWPILIGGQRSLLLGPLAVQPELRGKGIGIALMQKGIEEARKLGYSTIILVGDEPYYGRVGFVRLKPGQVRFPGPVDGERVLGLALQRGALEKLEGRVARASNDLPVSANAAPLG
jgi:predicted N-acetyltransferase YhbS